MTWREYHQATKHTDQSLRRAQHTLDWANMPDPFRHYEGVPVLDLPADPPAPEIRALDLLVARKTGTPLASDGPAFLSALLYHSAAISATKRVPSTDYKYALRVNPSSGNLHPTEFHFLTRGLKQWPDGLYHYRPSSHMAEQRATGGHDLEVEFTPGPAVFVLTSIAWREAWKYGSRAYRYCLLDIGHAWQSLALAAVAMGCETYSKLDFADDEIARCWRLNEDEWPMLVVSITDRPAPLPDPDPPKTTWFAGAANQLSSHPIVFPLIESIHEATKQRDVFNGAALQPKFKGQGAIQLPPPALSRLTFAEVTRKRRSALDFLGGNLSISQEQLSAILGSTSGRYKSSLIQLYLYAHRVDGLEPGVYRYWQKHGELELIRSGDQRVAAAGLSLGQDLAGNACVAFSMVADFERVAANYGDRGYRYIHFAAGALGQCLYLSAEALGLGATGIGAFFDDKVHDYLNIAPHQGQVVYHFAIGYPVADPRLSGAEDRSSSSA